MRDSKKRQMTWHFTPSSASNKISVSDLHIILGEKKCVFVPIFVEDEVLPFPPPMHKSITPCRSPRGFIILNNQLVKNWGIVVRHVTTGHIFRGLK